MIRRFGFDSPRIYGIARHGALALALALTILPSASTADEDFGKVVFEYVDPASSQCVSGIETPFRAAFSSINITLVPLDNLYEPQSQCYRTERRGVESTRIAVDCDGGGGGGTFAPRQTGIAAQLNGTISACQRGPEVRLMDSALTVSLSSLISSDGEGWDVVASPNSRRYSIHDDFNSFVERILLRQSWTRIKNGRKEQFEQRPKQLTATITDVPVRNKEKLPTNDVYGIVIETKIAAKFGAVETSKDGETQ